ncbi:MAG: hypothetical protein AB7S26_32055 [Sandaracinaceae bacterium]
MRKGSFALAMFAWLAVGCAAGGPTCASNADCADGLVCVAERCRTSIGRDSGDGAIPDGGVSGTDAGDADGGVVDAGDPMACTLGAGGCAAGTECVANDPADACRAGAAGTCVARASDDGAVSPECGCDGWSYVNGTARREAGIELQHDGFCTCAECASEGTCDRGTGCGGPEPPGVCVVGPTTCEDSAGELGWGCGETSPSPTYPNECSRLLAHAERVERVPSSCPGAAGRAGCCYLDADCATRSEACYGTRGCATAEEGVCLPPPGTGDCYGARDCAPGYECAGATVTPCEPGLSSPGRCVVRTAGLRG